MAQYEYDNVRSVPAATISPLSASDYQTRFGFYRTRLGSHLTAMLLAGVKVNEANTVYLEAGYSMLWGKTTFVFPVSEGPVSVSMKNRLNGGIACIGWKHYFMNNVFVDLSYDYKLYKGKSKDREIKIGARVLQNPKRVAINGITATVNYLFNI